MIEDPDPYLLTNGSGSGRPKNMWIRIRTWIRNTGSKKSLPHLTTVASHTWVNIDLHVLIQIILLARWLQWSRSQILLLLLSIFLLILLWLSLGARTSLKGGKRGLCGTDRD
jgi:hypothetical protein